MVSNLQLKLFDPVRLSGYVLCLLSVFEGVSQEVRVEDRYDEFFAPQRALYLAYRHAIIPEDYFMGAEFGTINPERTLSFFVSFDFRPYRKRFLNYQGNNLFIQNVEERFIVGAGAEYMKYIPKKPYGGFAQLTVGYTWGNYGGTDQNPPDGLVINPRIGAFWSVSRHFMVKAGYTYLDIKGQQAQKHGFNLSLNLLMVK